ncbi:SIR2 family protein [Azospirillum argentinense]
MTGSFAQDRLVDFAERVASANVVFFVGAGFSRDSEGNTGERLVRRLAARVLGLCDALAAELKATGPKAAEVQRLRDTFKALHASGIDETKPEFVWELSRNYYPFNDWCVSALADLADMLCDLHHALAATPAAITALIARVETCEAHWLATIGSGPPAKPPARPGMRRPTPRLARSKPMSPDPAKLKAICLATLKDIRTKFSDKTILGKILFLEAMGFDCQEVMAGDLTGDRRTVLRSFRGRLRRRHHVLARLAREGLSPVLLTTNFDLLIEGAYRLAGFSDWASGAAPSPAPGPSVEPPTRHPFLARITAAPEFFEKRDGGRVASIVKIHGCTDAFRAARGAALTVDWRPLLRTIVFTYREVQNWRQDSWSRDLVYTLLRTRAVAFCGYSTADPVLHDTVRNTYEDMAQRTPTPATAGSRCENAPAFFFGPRHSKEFHGLEVLRAASRAIGVGHPELTGHPNYLHFRFAGEPDVADLDESFAWIFHAVFRRRQIQAVEAELGSVASLLLGHPVPGRLLDKVSRDLQALWKREQRAARRWGSATGDRVAFAHTVAWTEHFHPALLRDMAIAQRTAILGRPTPRLDDLRDGYWYYPANENFGWTAWGAVVELALRRLTAHLAGQPSRWTTASLPAGGGPPLLSPLTNDDMPAVGVTRGAGHPLPVRLELSLGRFHRPGTRPTAHALPAATVRWESGTRTLPWSSAPIQGPAAATLWTLATGMVGTAPPTSHRQWIDSLRNPT